MDAEGIQHVLHELGSTRIRIAQGNVMASCPFAAYGGHSSAIDKHPSFSVRINPNGESPWNCFTCGKKGTLRGLLYQIAEISGRKNDFQALRQFIEENQERSLSSRLQKRGEFEPFPKRNLNEVLSAHIEFQHGWYGYREPPKLNFADFQQYVTLHPYAKSRGITQEQVEKWKIGFYKNRLFFPIFDEMKDMVGYSGRAIYPDQEPKYLHCQGFKKERHLYGEQHFDGEYETGFLSEGFMDVLRLDRIGLPNVYGSMGTTLSLEQASKLAKRFDEIIIFAHNDKPPLDGSVPPGLKGAQQSASLLKSKKPTMRVLIAPMIEGVKDVGDMDDEQLRWVLQKLKMWRESDGTNT